MITFKRSNKIERMAHATARIASRVAMYAVVVWYVAEITGNGMELRTLARRGALWGKYFAEYSLWYARREVRNGRR